MLYSGSQVTGGAVTGAVVGSWGSIDSGFSITLTGVTSAACVSAGFGASADCAFGSGSTVSTVLGAAGASGVAGAS